MQCILLRCHHPGPVVCCVYFYAIIIRALWHTLYPFTLSISGSCSILSILLHYQYPDLVAYSVYCYTINIRILWHALCTATLSISGSCGMLCVLLHYQYPSPVSYSVYFYTINIRVLWHTLYNAILSISGTVAYSGLCTNGSISGRWHPQDTVQANQYLGKSLYSNQDFFYFSILYRKNMKWIYVHEI